MGRKTYDSIGRPLPGRTNVVITRDTECRIEGCVVVHSIDEALTAIADQDEVMVIGGASFYEQMLERADKLYVTLVHDHKIEGDAHFPEIDDQHWRQTFREDHQADDKNNYDYSFIVYEKQEAPPA